MFPLLPLKHCWIGDEGFPTFGHSVCERRSDIVFDSAMRPVQNAPIGLTTKTKERKKKETKLQKCS